MFPYKVGLNPSTSSGHVLIAIVIDIAIEIYIVPQKSIVCQKWLANCLDWFCQVCEYQSKSKTCPEHFDKLSVAPVEGCPRFLY